jgi:hypothetical protein
MAEEPSSPAPLGEISHGPSKFEEFLDKNQKKLILTRNFNGSPIPSDYSLCAIKTALDFVFSSNFLKRLSRNVLFLATS